MLTVQMHFRVLAVQVHCSLFQMPTVHFGVFTVQVHFSLSQCSLCKCIFVPNSHCAFQRMHCAGAFQCSLCISACANCSLLCKCISVWSLCKYTNFIPNSHCAFQCMPNARCASAFQGAHCASALHFILCIAVYSKCPLCISVYAECSLCRCVSGCSQCKCIAGYSKCSLCTPPQAP